MFKKRDKIIDNLISCIAEMEYIGQKYLCKIAHIHRGNRFSIDINIENKNFTICVMPQIPGVNDYKTFSLDLLFNKNQEEELDKIVREDKINEIRKYYYNF